MQEEEQKNPEGRQESNLPAAPEQHQPPRAPTNSPKLPEEEDQNGSEGIQNIESPERSLKVVVDSPSRKKLSFGVELEFNVAFQTPDAYTTDPDPQDPRQIFGIVTTVMQSEHGEAASRKEEAHEHIANKLRNAGVHARAYWDKVREDQDKPELWMVKDDISVMAWDEDYEFMATEVVSPPFYSCEEARLQTSGICQLLTTNYRINCNDKTGLHVHVGNGHDGFTNQVLVNLMATLWVFEDRLERLHPPRRRSGHSGSNWCPSLRTGSALGTQVPYTPEGKREGLKRILELRTQGATLSIVRLMSCEGKSSRLAYNVHHLNESAIIDAEEMSRRTIEFRGHEGTMDPDRILNWVNVCLGLVEFADTVDSDSLEKFLWSHIDDEEEAFDVIDLLRAIGRPAEADFYSKRFQEVPRLLADDSSEEEDSSRRSSSASYPSDSPERVRAFLAIMGGPRKPL